METGIGVSANSGFKAIASPWHTLFILAIEVASIVRGLLMTSQLRAAAQSDRLMIYYRTIVFQWIVFALVLAGLWLRGTSVYTVLGERWKSFRQFFTDLGKGLAFLIGSIVLQSAFASHAQEAADKQATHFLLPQTGVEIAWWLLLSLTAGICEEALYRGYFQQQFTAFTRSAPVGIVLSAALFGAAHAYQNPRQAVIIGTMGVAGGALAYWRGSTRPGMIAHTLQDVIGGLAQHG